MLLHQISPSPPQTIFDFNNCSHLENPNQTKPACLPNLIHSLTKAQLGPSSPRPQSLQTNPITLPPNPPQNSEQPSNLSQLLQLGQIKCWVSTRPQLSLPAHPTIAQLGSCPTREDPLGFSDSVPPCISAFTVSYSSL